MSSQERLGQGLSALLGSAATKATTAPIDHVSMIAIEKLHSGAYQPRMEIEDEPLRQLADSIRAHGIIQPILARESDSGTGFEIIAGERRWRAAQMAGLHEVPVIVRTLNDQSSMAMALIENIQREDLNPVEEANMIRRLVEEFNLSHAQVGENVGKSRATITNILRLLSLAEPVLEMLQNRQIETGHAKVLLALAKTDQIEAARVVVQNALNVRKTEDLVKRWGERGRKSGKIAKPKDSDISRLERELSEKVGAKADIHDRNGKGYIRIHYGNLDELDGILERMNLNIE
ncbi:MAG: ParB/RepB/Spo0J family partition protein [Acidiferrobacterales bacterium]|nr:ParB/RepB/Spo0J family partition protein [Acidiferrobacterales bacterium]